MRKNKLIQVVFKGKPDNKYLFMTEDMQIENKDLVLCDTAKGVEIGVVVNDDEDVSIINSPNITKPIKIAKYACKSSHDISSSRNDFLKAYCCIANIIPCELDNLYETYISIHKN